MILLNLIVAGLVLTTLTATWAAWEACKALDELERGDSDNLR